MKRITLLLVFVLLAFFLAGCGEGKNNVVFNEVKIDTHAGRRSVNRETVPLKEFRGIYAFDLSAFPANCVFSLEYGIDAETGTTDQEKLENGVIRFSDEETEKTFYVFLSETTYLSEYGFPSDMSERPSVIASQEVHLFHLDLFGKDQQTHARLSLDGYRLSFYFSAYSDREVVDLLEAFIETQAK